MTVSGATWRTWRFLLVFSHLPAGRRWRCWQTVLAITSTTTTQWQLPWALRDVNKGRQLIERQQRSEVKIVTWKMKRNRKKTEWGRRRRRKSKGGSSRVEGSPVEKPRGAGEDSSACWSCSAEVQDLTDLLGGFSSLFRVDLSQRLKTQCIPVSLKQHVHWSVGPDLLTHACGCFHQHISTCGVSEWLAEEAVRSSLRPGDTVANQNDKKRDQHWSNTNWLTAKLSLVQLEDKLNHLKKIWVVLKLADSKTFRKIFPLKLVFLLN